MFFVKTTVGDGFPVEVELYEDEIYTYCPGCGKVIYVTNEVLVDILKECDLPSTSLICSPECTEKWKKEIATAEDSD